MSPDKMFKTVLGRMVAGDGKIQLPGHKCSRGEVTTVLLDGTLNLIGHGKNVRPLSEGVCDCDDGADTNVKGSKTCGSVHSEIVALLDVAPGRTPHTALVTRPPCKNCMSALMYKGVRVVVTTDMHPDRDNQQERFVNAGGVWKIFKLEELENA